MRDKEQTKSKILQAVGKLLADGQTSPGVNSVAREAGVDKVLIYRYFGGMPELLKAYLASGEFWPDFEDIMETSPYVAAMMPPAEIGTRFIHGFLRELRSRPLTLEILRRELTSPDELTTAFAQVREASAREIAECYGDRADEMNTIHTLLAAGLIHLLLHGRRNDSFQGIALQTDEDWLRIEQTATEIFNRLTS